MNLKDFRDKFKLNKSNVKTFFRKQGLYVLIFLCVAAAGVTALLTWPSQPPAQNDENTGVSINEGERLDDKTAVRTTPTPSPQPSPEPSPTETPQETNKPVSVSSVKLTRPVEGQIINKFSGDSLVSFASLGMWQTHNGVDIKADKDTPVGAALAGTVSEVYANEADGGVVVIAHSDKTHTLYAGLSEMTVEVGDKVNAGQTIGKIGEMPSEMDLSYHLHFEYYTVKDGIKSYKDPAKYFK